MQKIVITTADESGSLWKNGKPKYGATGPSGRLIPIKFTLRIHMKGMTSTFHLVFSMTYASWKEWPPLRLNLQNYITLVIRKTFYHVINEILTMPKKTSKHRRGSGSKILIHESNIKHELRFQNEQQLHDSKTSIMKPLSGPKYRSW